MMNLDDYRANSQNFHELAKLNVFVESAFMDFLSLWFLKKAVLKSDDAQFQNWWHIKVR